MQIEEIKEVRPYCDNCHNWVEIVVKICFPDAEEDIYSSMFVGPKRICEKCLTKALSLIKERRL